ncbi:phage minor head protein [Thiothrix nivea]|uniref:Phage head morphogenesis protein, SPP1 gp7 family n=1 Tax=Thiothrix nivea (strain ATCC 35100 / DSM 5205 / JP2) TaxID=870187 RepID=A0A656HD29_THINJ|nr:phage minor head protein [Thiothrix nivea]EIJ33356.1 phage head morphogenesis protein, SPP1 gp7 family [Thiothrix nivea DSM 5205]
MTPEVQFGNLPSLEAINFLRNKLDITTAHWDDMLKEIHVKAFTVAGATRLALLQDLRGAVDKALADGESIGQFHNRFDEIVKQHGWQFRGKYAWRTRVIYDTNMRSAHMAGKWEQIQRSKKTFPYLQYRTAGDSRVRPEHARWDNLILPVDDPFWDTHYPPNGWGCRCTVRSLSAREMERKGLKVGERPEIISPDTPDRVNTRTGEVYGKVPDGIDTGWDYNVGKAWLAPEDDFGRILVQQQPAIRAQIDSYIDEVSRPFQAAFEGWAKQVINKEYPFRRHQVVVGYVKSAVITHALEKGVKLETATIAIDANQLQHMRRDAKAEWEKSIPDEFILNLPTEIASPTAILWESSTNNILYIFGTAQDGRDMKVFVALNFKRKGDVTNSIRSGGLIPRISLQNAGEYQVIWGKI